MSNPEPKLTPNPGIELSVKRCIDFNRTLESTQPIVKPSDTLDNEVKLYKLMNIRFRDFVENRLRFLLRMHGMDSQSTDKVMDEIRLFMEKSDGSAQT